MTYRATDPKPTMDGRTRWEVESASKSLMGFIYGDDVDPDGPLRITWRLLGDAHEHSAASTIDALAAMQRAAKETDR